MNSDGFESSGPTAAIKGLWFLKWPAITVPFEYYLGFPFVSIFFSPYYTADCLFLQISPSKLQLFFKNVATR